jgi:capsular polysaccharide biosynthesis protein
MAREKLDISETEFPKIKAGNTAGTNLISMEINSDRTDQAKTVLGELSNLIIANHQERTKDAKALLESQIELKKKDIETVNKDIERVKAKVAFLEDEKSNLEAKVTALQKVLVYRQDAGSQFALFDAKEKVASKKQEIENTYMEVNLMEGNINAINGQINILEKQILDIRMTKVVKGPAISEKIVSPDIVSNLIIAVIFGLFLGIFLSFAMEWWEKNKGSIVG